MALKNVFFVRLHKAYFFLLLLQISLLPVNAQQKQGDGTIPIYIKTDNMSFIDEGYLRVSYAFNADNIKDSKTYIDLQRLEIGKKLSKYYSFFAFHTDSLSTEWTKKHPKAQSAPYHFSDSKRCYYWSEYQYSECFKKGDVMAVYSRMPHGLKKYDSKHVEQLPLQKWELAPGTLKIKNYLCHKAICTFRGRKYIAWYTKEIPVSNGPWKFGGLPGLILKIYDTGQLYTFECIKVERFKFPIKQYDYSNYKERSREDLLKLQRDINEDFYKISKSRSMKTGEYMSKFTPYQPMELN